MNSALRAGYSGGHPAYSRGHPGDWRRRPRRTRALSGRSRGHPADSRPFTPGPRSRSRRRSASPTHSSVHPGDGIVHPRPTHGQSLSTRGHPPAKVFQLLDRNPRGDRAGGLSSCPDGQGCTGGEGSSGRFVRVNQPEARVNRPDAHGNPPTVPSLAADGHANAADARVNRPTVQAYRHFAQVQDSRADSPGRKCRRKGRMARCWRAAPAARWWFCEEGRRGGMQESAESYPAFLTSCFPYSFPSPGRD